MNDDTAKKIQDIYETLPKEIQDVVSSDEVGKKLEKISLNHSLHIDQAGELSDLTTMVMLGLLHPNEYTNKIKSDLEISSDEALKIADEINEQILRPIKSSIMKIYTDDTFAETPTEEDHSKLNAADILNEIENPTVSTTPTPTKATRTVTKPLVEGTGINLIEQKLTQVVRAPEIQKVSIDANPKPSITSIQKPVSNKNLDPYREQI